MLVDLDYINTVKRRFAQINAEDIENIKWVKNGETVSLTKQEIEEFKFMGLNNTDINSVAGFTPKTNEQEIIQDKKE